MKFLNPQFIRARMQQIRTEGFKAFIKNYGWKVVVGVILFYLIRDTLLYIVIPFLVLNNFITCQ